MDDRSFGLAMVDPGADVFSWPAGSLEGALHIGAVVVVREGNFSLLGLGPAGVEFCSSLAGLCWSEVELRCALECDWVPRALRGGFGLAAAPLSRVQ